MAVSTQGSVLRRNNVYSLAITTCFVGSSVLCYFLVLFLNARGYPAGRWVGLYFLLLCSALWNLSKRFALFACRAEGVSLDGTSIKVVRRAGFASGPPEPIAPVVIGRGSSAYILPVCFSGLAALFLTGAFQKGASGFDPLEVLYALPLSVVAILGWKNLTQPEAAVDQNHITRCYEQGLWVRRVSWTDIDSCQRVIRLGVFGDVEEQFIRVKARNGKILVTVKINTYGCERAQRLMDQVWDAIHRKLTGEPGEPSPVRTNKLVSTIRTAPNATSIEPLEPVILDRGIESLFLAAMLTFFAFLPLIAIVTSKPFDKTLPPMLGWFLPLDVLMVMMWKNIQKPRARADDQGIHVCNVWGWARSVAWSDIDYCQNVGSSSPALDVRGPHILVFNYDDLEVLNLGPGFDSSPKDNESLDSFWRYVSTKLTGSPVEPVPAARPLRS